MSKLRIDAPKWANKRLAYWRRPSYRLIRESDWRKIMAVLRAADEDYEMSGPQHSNVGYAAEALRAHLAKRRAVQQSGGRK